MSSFWKGMAKDNGRNRQKQTSNNGDNNMATNSSYTRQSSEGIDHPYMGRNNRFLNRDEDEGTPDEDVLFDPSMAPPARDSDTPTTHSDTSYLRENETLGDEYSLQDGLNSTRTNGEYLDDSIAQSIDVDSTTGRTYDRTHPYHLRPGMTGMESNEVSGSGSVGSNDHEYESGNVEFMGDEEDEEGVDETEAWVKETLAMATKEPLEQTTNSNANANITEGDTDSNSGRIRRRRSPCGLVLCISAIVLLMAAGAVGIAALARGFGGESDSADETGFQDKDNPGVPGPSPIATLPTRPTARPSSVPVEPPSRVETDPPSPRPSTTAPSPFPTTAPTPFPTTLAPTPFLSTGEPSPRPSTTAPSLRPTTVATPFPTTGSPSQSPIPPVQTAPSQSAAPSTTSAPTSGNPLCNLFPWFPFC